MAEQEQPTLVWGRDAHFRYLSYGFGEHRHAVRAPKSMADDEIIASMKEYFAYKGWPTE